VLKSHIVHEAAVELAARDPAAAAELVEKWAGVVDYYTYRAGAAAVVAEAWARQSPERAAAWAEKLTPEHDRAAALRAAARGWGTLSAAAARAWAESLHNPQDAVPALVGVAEAELPPPARFPPPGFGTTQNLPARYESSSCSGGSCIRLCRCQQHVTQVVLAQPRERRDAGAEARQLVVLTLPSHSGRGCPPLPHDLADVAIDGGDAAV
jgi:hypothetical protein